MADNWLRIYYYCIFTVTAVPSIIAQPLSKAIREGEANVTAMSCNVTGMGPIYFQWERYNAITSSWMKPSRRAVNIRSPNLVFNIIEEEDEGVYRCIITNNNKSIVSDNATIFVYGEYFCMQLVHTYVYEMFVCICRSSKYYFHHQLYSFTRRE